MNDPIVDEVRRAREEYAARFNYDLDAMFRDLKEQEKRSGRKFANYGAEAAKAPAPAPPVPIEAPLPVASNTDAR